MHQIKDKFKVERASRHTQEVLIERLEPRLYRLIETCGTNAQTIIDYVNTFRNEISISDNYERNNIKTLADLSKFHSDGKFKTMDKDDISYF